MGKVCDVRTSTEGNCIFSKRSCSTASFRACNLTGDIIIPDPEGWGKINPYQSLESPKGSTIHESNFITVIPGYVPRESAGNGESDARGTAVT